jgi:hypothetical protein
VHSVPDTHKLTYGQAVCAAHRADTCADLAPYDARPHRRTDGQAKHRWAHLRGTNGLPDQSAH